MSESLHHVTRLVVLFVVVLSSAALAGCGVLVTWYADRHVNDEGNDDSKYKVEDDTLLQDLAKQFGLMALLSEAVYRRDLEPAERDKNGCAYIDAAAGAPLPEYGMPVGSYGRWKRWVPPTELAKPTVSGAAKNAPMACLNDPSGLYYETYVLERQGQLVEAVIAFRGTENRSGQTFRDWRSNIAAFFGFEPAQYKAARLQMEPLINALSIVLGKQSGTPKIYATGHSLGGGLAQQAGYMSKSVLEVYTFNTTPVTNWSKLRLQKKIGNAYPIFHRIYHGGEFLEKIRFVSTSATKARFGRHDIGVQLKDRSNVAGHSIQLMACEFARLVSDSGVDDASHGYPSKWIRDVLLNDRVEDQPCSKEKAGY